MEARDNILTEEAVAALGMRRYFEVTWGVIDLACKNILKVCGKEDVKIFLKVSRLGVWMLC